jgi:hypothetical protein
MHELFQHKGTLLCRETKHNISTGGTGRRFGLERLLGVYKIDKASCMLLIEKCRTFLSQQLWQIFIPLIKIMIVRPRSKLSSGYSGWLFLSILN